MRVMGRTLSIRKSPLNETQRIPVCGSPRCRSECRSYFFSFFISLLSLVGKTFERHIFNLIYDHLKLSNFLSSRQFGFRPGFSTETALLFATNSWFSSLEHGTSVCSVFLDLKKAFDSVPHRPLLNTLATLNLTSHLLCWIHSYLSNRSQRVKVSGCLSKPCQVLSGVPQGSILGPLLFLIYVNDITNVSLSPQSNLILYADDILYFCLC